MSMYDLGRKMLFHVEWSYLGYIIKSDVMCMYDSAKNELFQIV